MIAEIKLFMLTNHLMALYKDDQDKVFRELKNLTEYKDNDYWDEWKERYRDITLSTETQVILMRSAGYTYRVIQNVAKVSPGTIHDIIKQYDLNYHELEKTEKIEDVLTVIGERMRKAGHEIW